MLLAITILNLSAYAANETKTIGTTGADYTTLKAAFDDVNNGSLTGNITLQIINNTTETSSAVLNASGSGANYNSISIYPTVANLSIIGNINTALVDLNGANNVVIDGRVNATGTDPSLIISNTSTSGGTTSTIRFVNDASNNTVRYCQIKGSERSFSSGIVFFSTTIIETGNDNNSINNNLITSSTDTNRPTNAIYSEGSPGIENNNNTISNNNIFNFFSRSSTSYGINIYSNSTTFTISNNSFYETTTFIPSSAATYWFININSSGSGFQIQNNYLGGSATQCGGTSWIKTNAKNNAFNGITIAAGNENLSLIDGNKISNINWTNIDGGNWTGIQIQSGEVNIGTQVGNIIGDVAGTSAIQFSVNNIGQNTNVYMYPIQISSPDNVNCVSNKIGALSITNVRNLICINKNSESGTKIISDNIIGNSTTLGSITITTNPLASTQFFIGIHVQGGLNTVNNNTISNLISNSTGSGFVRGIEILTGSNNVTNNLISKIATASTNSISLIGLSFSNNSFNNVISSNRILEIENTNSLNNSGSVIGMNLDLTGDNIISKNFIHDILVSPLTNDTKIYGIKAVNGITTYSNNIVSLGTSVASTIYGIFESGLENCNMYHNTVYINGSPTSGLRNSYAFYSANGANTLNYINNIFANYRTNNGATGKNYAAYFSYSSASSLSLNYNLYFANGNGGMLGYFASTDKAALPIITAQDANSFNYAPGFLNIGGGNPADYKQVITKFVGDSSTGISEDFGGAIRTAVPNIGAWEFAGANMWKGSISTDWGNSLNWTLSAIPASGANISFDPFPLNQLILDTDRTVNDITNNQSTYQILINGKTLEIQGALNFTNGAKLETASENSTLFFTGNANQNLNASWLINNEAYNIKLNNSSFPVFLTGNLVVLNSITSNGRLFNAVLNSPTLTYKGTNPQTISNSIFFKNQIYNLNIDNSLGVTIDAPIIISNALTINSGKKLILSPISRVEVNGLLANNGGTNGLVLSSTTLGTASLIHNTNNVQATSQRYIGGAATAWHFLSTPIQNQSLSGNWKPAGTYSDGTGYDLYVWDEPSNCWVYNLNTTVAPTWNTVNPSSNFIAGKGYLYALQTSNTTQEFSGILNNGDISANVTNSSSKTYKGFNFIGNPYPSSIDWKNNAGFNRSMLETIGGGYNIWIWSNTANNYGVFNSAFSSDSGTNYSTRYISANMGFFVKAATAGTFSFKNASRVNDFQADWLRTKALQNKTLDLSLKVNSTENLGSDEIKMGFGFDFIQSGATKMFSPVKSAPSLFLPNENEDYSTYYFTDTNEKSTIELNFKAGKDGKYELSASESKTDFEVILLEDKLSKKIIDLKVNDNYTFTSKTTDNPARFNIHFSKTAIDELVFGFVNVFNSNNSIIIDLKSTKGNFNVKIFDINGIVFDAFTAVGGEQRIVPNPTNGVLFIQLYNNEKTKTFKLLN